MANVQSVTQRRLVTEIQTWSTLAFALALLEGGVIGALLQQGFASLVPEWQLNWAVGIAAGAPYYANLLSFLWVKLGMRARDKQAQQHLVSNLALVICVCCFVTSLLPVSSLGLLLILLLLIAARICWSGITTIRSAIWRTNYPRSIRARVTAKYTTVAALSTSIGALIAGWVIDSQFEAFRLLYMAFAVIALFGAVRYRALSVRYVVSSARKTGIEGQRQSTFSISHTRELFAADQPFAQYMIAMFVMGLGNLMLMGLLIIGINEFIHITRTEQIVATTVLPMLVIPFTVKYWARLMEGNHIFYFRIIHGSALSVAFACFLLSIIFQMDSLLFLASLCYGVGMSGGMLGWNLGHNDFACNNKALDYMAIHVTLTGVRGILAPLIAVSFYQGLQTFNAGQFAVVLPLVLVVTGTFMFYRFHERYRELHK